MDKNRPHCKMPWCTVEVNPPELYCAGHIFLKEIDQRKVEEFARKSKELLKQIIKENPS